MQEGGYYKIESQDLAGFFFFLLADLTLGLFFYVRVRGVRGGLLGFRRLSPGFSPVVVKAMVFPAGFGDLASLTGHPSS